MTETTEADLLHVFDEDLRAINRESEIYYYQQGVTRLIDKFNKLWEKTEDKEKPQLAGAFAAAIENQASSLPKAETVNGLHSSTKMTGLMFDALLKTGGADYVPDSLGDHFLKVSERLTEMGKGDYGANVIREFDYSATLLENKALKLKLAR